MRIKVRPNGIAVRLVDFSEMYDRTPDKLILNTFDLTKVDEKLRLTKLLYTHYDGDTLGNVPTCECELTTGKPNERMRCPECNTLVLPVTERPLVSIAWLKPPEGVAPFLNPQVWTILSAAMTVTGVNLLEWLCNPHATLPAEPNRFLRRFMALRIPQGINYFYQHFDEVMGKMFDAGLIYASGNKRQRQDLTSFLHEYRDRLFTEALPIPSKLSFITERTVTRTYGDKTMYSAFDAILTITSTENAVRKMSLRDKHGRSVKANMLLAKFYQDFIGGVLARKPGLLRKHVMGSRLHMTFRAVISSLSANHDRRELHLPWSMAVKVFDAHLTSLLYKRGCSVNAAASYLADHVLKYSDLLAELFDLMIQQAPRMGIPVLLNRNPTLMRGSIQRLYVTQVKPDPKETSISMSVLALKAPNADKQSLKVSLLTKLIAGGYHVTSRWSTLSD